MSFVKCSVDGCNARLQPLAKPIRADRDTRIYRECDHCLRPACAAHSTEVGEQIICDRCRRTAEGRPLPIELIDLGLPIRPAAD